MGQSAIVSDAVYKRAFRTLSAKMWQGLPDGQSNFLRQLLAYARNFFVTIGEA